jgi:hypothetical protein
MEQLREKREQPKQATKGNGYQAGPTPKAR